MEKVLVIRKPDRTIHQVALANRAVLLNINNRKAVGDKWKFEVMDKVEADKLGFIDDDYVTPGEAQARLKQSEAVISEKDQRIAELEQKLALLNMPANLAPPTPSKDENLSDFKKVEK